MVDWKGNNTSLSKKSISTLPFIISPKLNRNQHCPESESIGRWEPGSA